MKLTFTSGEWDCRGEIARQPGNRGYGITDVEVSLGGGSWHSPWDIGLSGEAIDNICLAGCDRYYAIINGEDAA